jgi:hypothetical protein
MLDQIYIDKHCDYLSAEFGTSKSIFEKVTAFRFVI